MFNCFVQVIYLLHIALETKQEEVLKDYQFILKDQEDQEDPLRCWPLSKMPLS